MNKACPECPESPRGASEVKLEQTASQASEEAWGVPTVDAEGSPASLGPSGTTMLPLAFLRIMHELVAQRADTEAAWAAEQGEAISMGLCRPR